MRIERNQTGIDSLMRGLDQAASAGRRDVQNEVRARQARRSGRLAGSYTEDENGVYSGVVYAGAVERGANVGPRRGPHMTGNRRLREAGDKWLDHTTRHLRGML